jgi:hypothetical protein
MDQFIGFIFFLVMALSGFWCLTFLIGIIPYWLGPGLAETRGKINADVDPETVRYKKLYEQEGVEVLYQK